MDIETLAKTIAYVAIAALSVAFGVWLLIELPLWAAPLMFGVAVFFGLVFLGPLIAIAAFCVAALIKAAAWLVSHRRARA